MLPTHNDWVAVFIPSVVSCNVPNGLFFCVREYHLTQSNHFRFFFFNFIAFTGICICVCIILYSAMQWNIEFRTWILIYNQSFHGVPIKLCEVLCKVETRFDHFRTDNNMRSCFPRVSSRKRAQSILYDPQVSCKKI